MWFLVAAALAACPPDLSAHLDTVEASPSVDVAAVEALLACHDAPVDASAASRVHRLLARAADAAGDAPRAARHLYAAWEAWPFFAPEGSAAALASLQQLQEAPPPAPVAPPAPFLAVDGRPATWVRAGQPAVLQGAGRPAALFDDRHPLLPAELRPTEKRGRGALIASAVVGAVAGVSFGAAHVSKANYERTALVDVADRPAYQDTLERSYRTTNVLAVGSGVAAAGALGLLVVHVVR